MSRFRIKIFSLNIFLVKKFFSKVVLIQNQNYKYFLNTIAMKVIRKDKNKILVRDDINESTQWFSVKKKSTLHQRSLLEIHRICEQAKLQCSQLFCGLYLSISCSFCFAPWVSTEVCHSQY